jgi:hypothetical protein
MTKNVFLLAAVAAALLVPQFAVAGTVTYTTTGTFSSSGTNTSGKMPVTFTGTTQTVTTPDLNALLGSFSVGTFGQCHHSLCTKSDHFTLHIAQSAPSPGSGNLTATVTGFVVFNQTTGTVQWTFDPLGTTVVINGVTYTGLPGVSTLSTDVRGIITGGAAVPEPKAGLLLGLGSVGLMGLAFASRKMINVN